MMFHEKDLAELSGICIGIVRKFFELPTEKELSKKKIPIWFTLSDEPFPKSLKFSWEQPGIYYRSWKSHRRCPQGVRWGFHFQKHYYVKWEGHNKPQIHYLMEGVRKTMKDLGFSYTPDHCCDFYVGVEYGL